MKWMFLGIAALAGSASAQSWNPNDMHVVTANLGPTAAFPQPGVIPSPFLMHGDVTPTMRRQQIARARKVALAFPELAAQMRTMTPNQAANAYRRAQRAVMWTEIRAKEAQP